MLGLKQVGDPSDAPYDRSAGSGYVAHYDGQYSDALAKGIGVTLLHAETTGAISTAFMATLRILGRLSRRAGSIDLTQYGEGRASPKFFLTHHAASISTAIQRPLTPRRTVGSTTLPPPPRRSRSDSPNKDQKRRAVRVL